MLTSEQTAQVKTVVSAQAASMRTLMNFDFSPAFELDARLKANKELLQEFIQDPAAVAKREVGIVLPEGFHLHFIDQENKYHPAEGDALAQLQRGKDGKLWGRVEVRSAAGPGCIAACGICW